MLTWTAKDSRLSLLYLLYLLFLIFIDILLINALLHLKVYHELYANLLKIEVRRYYFHLFVKLLLKLFRNFILHLAHHINLS